MPRSSTFTARLTPFLRGVIWGMYLAGSTYEEIAADVVKPDGKSPCKQSIKNVIDKAEANGGFYWDGEVGRSTGRPFTTDKKLDKNIQKIVFQKRGSAKVTVAYIRKVLKAARKVSVRTVSRRLSAAGLAWLRRRRKSLVPTNHKPARLEWATWVLARQAVTLARWAYSDGAVFYIARSATELVSTNRAALGPMVWRQADGSDALYEDCVGPSAYWKAQGTKIRVWGLLVGGLLFITILPEEQVMNRWWYEWIVRRFFGMWIEKGLGRGARAFLVQDHERALWADEPRQAMRDVGIQLLENFPKCSQDLNPIETAWRELRARLAATEPSKLESREAFISRLRAAVSWLNYNRSEYFAHLCTDQKERALEVLERKGARTKF